MAKLELSDLVDEDGAVRYEFSSVEISVNGVPFQSQGITSIVYDAYIQPSPLRIHEANGTASCVLTSGLERLQYLCGVRPYSGYWRRRYDWDARKRRRA